MSDPNAAPGTQPASPAQFRGMLDDLLLEGERLKARAQQPAPDLRALLGLPEVGTVTITRDQRGLIDDIVFGRVDGRRPAHEELMQQLNLALFAGSRTALGALGSERTVTGSGDIAPELREFMAAVEAGGVPEPVSVTNDLKTVTVSALYGEVVAIDCSPSFVLAATDETLAEEIVRVAREAALGTDVLGKYADRSI